MTLLLLAGTGEARKIAQALASENKSSIASLSGATRAPKKLAIPTRIGGFGGRTGFETYLGEHEISAILDATHPFASQISLRSNAVADELNIPYVQFLRPKWQPEAGDNWHELTREQDAVKIIPPGTTVFLATGRQTLKNFSNLTERRLICRQIDPHDEPFPFKGGEYLIGRPPFSVADEVALFTRLSIDWLVVKNAGGLASRSKLDAARHLNIPVAMIRRPAQPQGPKVETIAQALDWVRALP